MPIALTFVFEIVPASKIFTLSGLIVWAKVHLSEDWMRQLFSLFAMYLILHVVRFLMVFGFRGLAGLEHRHGYGVGTKEGLVMVYSGLRGAVGLALAMEVWRKR